MTDPLHTEPFLTRPAPRCLTRPLLPREPEPRRFAWPLRVTFERWSVRLLRARSQGLS